MKKLSIFAVLILTTIILSSCDVNESYYNDYTPPSPPSGIEVLNGDNRVDISWNRNRESDVAGYNIYYNYTYEGKYTLIGSTSGTYFADVEAVNGNKYYYAVAAYDYNGKGPWKLIFLRTFDNNLDANRFELKLKKLRNKKFIRNEYSKFFLNE